MKRLVFTLSLFMMCAGAYASQDFVVDTFDQFTQIRNDYDTILSKLEKTDPEFVQQIRTNNSTTDDEKLSMLRSYLAQKAYDCYLDSFKRELNEKGVQTNRQVHDAVFEGSYYPIRTIWLDRGELETPECHLNGDVHEFEICYYPDGFEEYRIDIENFANTDTLTEKSFSLDKDDLTSGTHLSCEIGVSVENYISNENSANYASQNKEHSYGLNIACQTTKYTDYYAWLNQEVEDTINGKHDIIREEKLPNGTTRIIDRSDGNWKSNYLPESVVDAKDIQIGFSSSTWSRKL